MIKPPGRIEDGSVQLDGVELLELTDEEMRRVRLARISLVAQGAMNSLNPVKRIKDQIALGLREHGAARDLVADLLQARAVDLGHAGQRRDLPQRLVA